MSSAIIPGNHPEIIKMSLVIRELEPTGSINNKGRDFLLSTGVNNHREHRGHREKRHSFMISVYSVVDQLHCDFLYQNKFKNNKPQMDADKRRYIPVTYFPAQSIGLIHRKGRKERKAQRQISLRSGMKIINSELVRTLYELTLPEFVSVCFSSLFFPDRITRIGRIYTDPGAQRLEKAPWYEKNSNEHNELDELTPPGFVLVRTSSLFSSCSSMYQRFIADSVYYMFDQLHSYSFFQNKFRNNKPQMNADERRFVSLAPAFYNFFIREQSEGYENHSN